jgi:hypothetical protein
MASRINMAILVLLLIGAPGVVDAQVGLDVRGVVRDEAGGVIAGASVVLIDGSGKSTSTSSDSQGRYQVAAPGTGVATLTIEAPGFAPYSRRISPISTGAVTVDVALRVNASERVDVQAGLTGVSLHSGQNMATITLSGRNLDLLPNDPEGLLQTLRMLAGTTGMRPDQVAFYIDGAPIDRRLPPKDIIQAIRINANSFSAEFAEPGASRIDIITKPASEEYHGDGRFDFNDAVLNARSPFEPVRPPVQLRTYTGYIGGPILKKRLGLLVYGARWEQDENVVVDATTVNPTTFLAEPLRLNVATPIRTTSYSLKSDALLTPQHILAFEYAQDERNGHNAGLLSGFDLPERGYTTASREQTASLSLTSTFSDHILNEFRARASRRRTVDQADSGAPAILVLEAFNSGGNQDPQFRDNATDEIMVSNVSTFTGTHHSVRVGAQVQSARLSQIDRSNYNGTFTFGSDVVRDPFGVPILSAGGEPTTISALDLYRQTIARIPGALPSQFSIVRGDPSVAFPFTTGAAFVQDDWRLLPRLTVSFGARTEYEHELQNHFAIAPRAGVAWALSDDGRSTLRAGVGLFYSQIPQTMVSDVLRSRQSELLFVDRPQFFPSVPGTLPAAQTEVTTRTDAPNLTMPLLALSTLSVDRQIGPHLFASIGYTWKRGADLLRTRVISATDTGDAGGNALGPTLQFESTGRSNAHEIHLTTSGNVGSWLSVFGGYQWTHALQDTDGPFTIPASSSDLAAEWGPAQVPRHQVAAGASFALPGQISISPLVKVTSALPFNITTGMDNNRDTQFADRPAVAQPGDPGAVVTPYGVFNPNPGPGQIIIPRNSGVGPTEFTLDLTASWSSLGQLTTGDRATFAVTVNNLTNHLNNAPYNGVLTSPFFGVANRALNPRRITLSFRYDF